MVEESPGRKFRQALIQEKPLQIIGTVNAYVAMMAQRQGFRAIYLSGAGVANSSYGLPDLGMTTLDNVLEDVRRITSAVDLPLLVDIDTGWGSGLMIERAIKALIRAGAAGVHLEDQIQDKRCGHRPGKEIVSRVEMQNRIEAAAGAKTDPDFVIMARTDAFANEGLEGAIERALFYRSAGAEMLFPEALYSLEQYREFKKAVGIPTLANITEFGKTPMFTLSELRQADIDMALYPLSVNRAMNYAAQNALQEIRNRGTQKQILDKMQTREELYDFLNYMSYEEKLNQAS